MKKAIQPRMKSLISRENRRIKRETGLSLSLLTGKLTDIMALSFVDLGKCGSWAFCCAMASVVGSICAKCFSKRAMEFRPKMRPCFSRNGEIIRNGGNCFRIDPKVKYMRINSHGELSCMDEVLYIFNLALYNPHVTFGFWTKRTNIVQRALELMDCPPNVVLIHSKLMIGDVSEPAPGFHKSFCVVGKEDNTHKITCGARECRKCKKCYDVNNKETIVVERLK